MPETKAAPPKGSRFAKWIESCTPRAKLAKALGVSVGTLNWWRRGALGLPQGSRPRPELLGPILRLADGKLTALDIYPEQKES